MMKYEDQVIKLLEKRYPDAKTALNFSNPLELLVATILSAQCTDKRVNIVTADLFKKYKSAKDYAESTDLSKDIKSINFFNNKAKNIKKMAQMLVDKFHGNVPNSMEELITLPGVARKTANVVLSNAFGINVGITVDTHVNRVANRLGLTSKKDPINIEKDLMLEFDNKEWGIIPHLFISLGRDVCVARIPKCEACVLNKICPSSTVRL